MAIPFFQIDAFTSTPFAGNPAAVCLLDGPADEAWMQRVAAEMNLAETAFVHPAEGAYALRWFTPTMEVDLCGHATLAAAHALWETGQADAETLSFATRSGLPRRGGGDGAPGRGRKYANGNTTTWEASVIMTQLKPDLAAAQQRVESRWDGTLGGRPLLQIVAPRADSQS